MEILEKKDGRKTKKEYAEKTKIQAVQDWESGYFTKTEVLEKYGILFPKTLFNWALMYSKTPEIYVSKGKLTRIEIINAVKAIRAGLISKEDTAKKFNRSLEVVRKWLMKYPDSVIEEQDALLAQNPQIDVEPVMTTEEKQQFKHLEKALKMEKLRVLGLEEMISQAEKKFKIEIRKKCGSKQ